MAPPPSFAAPSGSGAADFYKRRLAMKNVEAALSNLEAVIGDEPLRRESAAIRESFKQRIDALDSLRLTADRQNEKASNDAPPT